MTRNHPQRIEPTPSAPAPAPRAPLTVVGLSGGVDSALSLALLLERGVAVQPVFMKNWEEDDTDQYCSAARDLDDAHRVCEVLGVELRTVNFSYEFWERVFQEFLAQIRAGRTPNPDVVCNQELKFRAFLDFAADLGAASIATGHYARLHGTDERVALLRAVDENKDQSYFLHRLNQEQLRRACFPVGELRKDEVRARAALAGLAVSGKKDSTGICFVGERPFTQFLASYVEPDPGPIRSVEGEWLGEHRGLAFHTIGQRQGLGIGGRRTGSGAPWYVAAKRPRDKTLLVAQGHDHPSLYTRSLLACDVHWIGAVPPPLPLVCSARIRHRQRLQRCCVRAGDGDRVRVGFDAPQWAVAPGQYVVFYQGQECLGGAMIEHAGEP